RRSCSASWGAHHPTCTERALPRCQIFQYRKEWSALEVTVHLLRFPGSFQTGLSTRVIRRCVCRARDHDSAGLPEGHALALVVPTYPRAMLFVGSIRTRYPHRRIVYELMLPWPILLARPVCTPGCQPAV